MAVSSLNSLSLNQGQFLQLLVTQLQNQDPTNPMSSNDMLNQVTQLSTLQSLQDLNTNFTDLLQLQQLTQGSSLLGRSVQFTDPTTSSAASGVVSALNVQNGNVILQVGTQSVPLSQVTSVMNASS
jgi:flagellar basal-body rod modification protein FlgD